MNNPNFNNFNNYNNMNNISNSNMNNNNNNINNVNINIPNNIQQTNNNNNNNSKTQKIDFCTLNENNIPDSKFLNTLDEYPLKLSEEIVSQILSEECGLNTGDPRVIKLITLASQVFVEDLISGTAETIMSKKNNNKFLEGKELAEVLKEKGYVTNKSQFHCDNLNINLDKNK